VTPEFLTINKPASGLPNYLYRVSKALINMGHIPIIVTSGERNEHVFYDGIEVYREITFSDFHKNQTINYLYNSVMSSYKLNKTVNKICNAVKVDIIQYASLYGLSMFHGNKAPSVIRLSSYAKIYYGSNKTYPAAYVKIMSFIERIAARGVSGIIAPSNIMAKEFQKDVHKKVHVIETPFENDAKFMDDTIYKEKFLNKKYILFFGTLYAEKGIYVIADVIHEILEKNQDYTFAFIGKNQKINSEDPLKTIYQKAGQYRDRIIYINPLKHEKLYPIIEKADLVVLPSLMENFSNACIEAMYFGRIVIGTQETSFEQLITDGENGFLAIPDNSSSLLRKINQQGGTHR
jgi:glycosyltransferase involved in cell wall biosynthesis